MKEQDKERANYVELALHEPLTYPDSISVTEAARIVNRRINQIQQAVRESMLRFGDIGIGARRIVLDEKWDAYQIHCSEIDQKKSAAGKKIASFTKYKKSE